MNLTARLSRLERDRPASPCPRCSARPRGFRLVLGRPGDRDEPPERCTICGRQIEWRLEFDRQG